MDREGCGKGKEDTKVQKWSRGISTLSVTSALDGVGGQCHPPGKTRYPLDRRLGGTQSVWTGAENLDPTGIRSQNRPANRESLYRLSYPGPYGQRRTVSNLDTSPLFTATCGGTSRVAVNGNRVQ
jgi:hypothetical protein